MRTVLLLKTRLVLSRATTSAKAPHIPHIQWRCTNRKSMKELFSIKSVKLSKSHNVKESEKTFLDPRLCPDPSQHFVPLLTNRKTNKHLFSRGETAAADRAHIISWFGFPTLEPWTWRSDTRTLTWTCWWHESVTDCVRLSPSLFQENCENVSLKCYMLELIMVLNEEEVIDNNASCVLAFNERLDSNPVSLVSKNPVWRFSRSKELI